MLSSIARVSILILISVFLWGCSSEDEGGTDPIDGNGGEDAFDLGDDVQDPLPEPETMPPSPEDEVMVVCEEGQTRCLDANNREVCEDGTVGFVSQACPEGTVCRCRR